MSIIAKALKKYREKGFFGLIGAALMKVSFVRMMNHRRIMHYLRTHYDYVIQRYKDYAPPPSQPNYVSEYAGVIWSMWWQGEENCPEVVKLCWASMRKHCGSHKLIIITKYNYQNYVTIPEHVLAKVESGAITLTHLSDIIRVNLLVKYGGFWLDSTIFVAKDIPEEIFLSEYFTIKRTSDIDPSNFSVSGSRWTGYCISAHEKNSLLFTFLTDFLSEYWRTQGKLIDYLLIDYLIALAFEEFPEFYRAWSSLPVNNTDSWGLLRRLINKPWDPEEYSQLTSSTQFFKLTYKRKFDKVTPSGQETFYGRLLSEYGI